MAELLKRLYKLVYSNKFFAFLMMLIQMFIFVSVYTWLSSYYFYLHSAMVILSVLLVIHEFNKSSVPEFKMTWIFIIMAAPVFGALLYIYLHLDVRTKDLNRSYIRNQHETRRYLEQNEETIEKLRATHPNAAAMANYLKKYSGSPVYENTKTDYFSTGEEAFEALKRDLLSAQSFIFLEFFIINQKHSLWHEILEILKQKAKEGVEVRISYDGMGSGPLVPKDYPHTLREYGIRCRVFSPVMPLLSTYQNNRDHRKICVIDGKIAYTGGVNIADEYANRIVRFGYWKDNAVRFEGDAAAGFTALFLEIWNIETPDGFDNYEAYISAARSAGQVQGGGYIVPFGDNPFDNYPVGKRAYIDNLSNAHEHVYIATPYLVIDNEMYEALSFASQKGVDVKIMMPHIPDKPYAFWLAHTYYTELVEAGIEIYEFMPGFLHAKMSLVDGRRAIVGTVNHDYRSMYLHYECGAYMIDVPEIKDMEQDFLDTLKKCKKITYEDCLNFPLYQRVVGKVARLFAPLI
ncbi:MAG: cardiolipin synthase [Clostridiales bacterium]|nr:cardiolipin synthase [Clostridiales bacterium]